MFCEADPVGTEERIKRIALWFSLVSQLVNGMIALATTYAVFCERQKNQRPKFVLWQLVTLQIGWILSFVYYLLLLLEGSPSFKQSKIENVVVLLSDATYFTADWLFFEQYLSVSLLLPTVLD